MSTYRQLPDEFRSSSDQSCQTTGRRATHFVNHLLENPIYQTDVAVMRPDCIASTVARRLLSAVADFNSGVSRRLKWAWMKSVMPGVIPRRYRV
jgi:hypothetical protein